VLRSVYVISRWHPVFGSHSTTPHIIYLLYLLSFYRNSSDVFFCSCLFFFHIFHQLQLIFVDHEFSTLKVFCSVALKNKNRFRTSKFTLLIPKNNNNKITVYDGACVRACASIIFFLSLWIFFFLFFLLFFVNYKRKSAKGYYWLGDPPESVPGVFSRACSRPPIPTMEICSRAAPAA